MKRDANLKSKSRNSFIYFQLGLIGIMLLVLFILEIQFKVSSNAIPVISINETFEVSNAQNYQIIEHKLQTVKAEKVDPVKKIPNDINKLLVKKDEVVENKELASQDVPPSDKEDTENIEPNNVNEGKSTTTKSSPTIFNVEQLPMFPECVGLTREKQKACFDEQLMKAIIRNLRYPETDLDKGKQGTALVEFVIDENGSIRDVKALDNKRATISMQKEAEKAVKKLPKLIPAKMGNENVRIKYSIPISFKIR